MKIFVLTLFAIFLFTGIAGAQVYSQKDVELCNETFSFAVSNNLSSKPLAEIISSVGKSFLGTDYLAYGIEKDGEEELVINLTGLDCTTFLENVLVFSRLIKKGRTTFDDYTNELRFIRYRDGVIDQYPSRLHYFSDWIFNNEKKGIIKDITMDAGGEPLKLNLNFMSSHPQYYARLTESPEFIPVIAEQEKEISKRNYYYIPKEKLTEAENFIKNGDIIAFISSIKGLDIGHVGIAVNQNNKIHLLHAPQKDEKVQITKKPLADYIKNMKKHTGIIILRPVEPDVLKN